MTTTSNVLVIPELHSGEGDEMREIPVERDVLAMLYREIKCTTVELVRLGDRVAPALDLYLDEEGLFKEAPQYNVRAMALILAATGTLHQFYVGRAVVARVDEEGDTIGLTPDHMRQVRLAIQRYSGKVERWAAINSIRMGFQRDSAEAMSPRDWS